MTPMARRARAVLGALGAAVAVAAFVVLRPRRIAVQGHSMEPTLSPGDRLLAVRSRHLRTGDVVAVRDPRDGRVLVKRIGALGDDGVVVRGDNPAASTDSRSFGPVPGDAVMGKVVRRYAPAWRAGPVR